MKKLSVIIRRHVSLFAFIFIYLIIAAVLLFLEAFQWETQWNVITTLVPFFLIGAMLDYMTGKNNELSTGFKKFSQLLPTGVFLLLGISCIVDTIGRPPIKFLEYLIWAFIALPFFITSYIRENYRKRLFSALLGTGFVGAVYLHLTTITDELNGGSVLIVYLICICLMFYAASGHKKLYFTGMTLGLIDAVVLIFLRNNPLTKGGKFYGWDFDIAYKFELLLLANFTVCIIICFFSAVNRGKLS